MRRSGEANSAASDASTGSTLSIVGLLVDNEGSSNDTVGAEEIDVVFEFFNISNTLLVSVSLLKVTSHFNRVVR